MPSTKPFLLFPSESFVYSKISSPFRTSSLGAAMEDQSSLSCMRGGAVDFHLGRCAANPAALLVFVSSVFLSDVAFDVAVPAVLHPSSHRTGLAQSDRTCPSIFRNPRRILQKFPTSPRCRAHF
ncbi:hypothetical protein L3X38_011103 [Prunus dulcis]|uniref:Uncharacterized protein n=1 Tax=Prunus dulcis TaxID=3755 RepID=A0AAD4WJ14_PRUDU|nr:hypothetical protein L3X38_011103 [Prunus dulcis]